MTNEGGENQYGRHGRSDGWHAPDASGGWGPRQDAGAYNTQQFDGPGYDAKGYGSQQHGAQQHAAQGYGPAGYGAGSYEGGHYPGGTYAGQGFGEDPYGRYASAPAGQQAPHGPRTMRRGTFAALAAGALALAVAIGAVPGWALGHASGYHDAQHSQQQWNNGSGSGRGDGSDGSSNGFGPGNNGFGQGSQGEYGQGQNGQGQGDDSQSEGNGTSSAIKKGTKLTDGARGIVMIRSQLNGGTGAGTGLVLTPDGTVLTNYHVVEGSTQVKVTDSTTNKTYTAEVKGHDATHDIAVLKVKDVSNLGTVTTAQGQVSDGDKVAAIGNSSGEGYLRKLTGTVIGTDESITAQSEATGQGEKLDGLIETDADVVPGYSGGALTNESGEVIGVTTAASSGDTSQTVNGYAVPIAQALSIVDQVNSGQASGDVKIGRGAALGISVLASNADQQGSGVAVDGVIKGGAAAKAGLSEGDTITSIGGDRIRSFTQLKEKVATYNPGDKVKVTYVTNAGSKKTAEITLQESTVN